MGWQDWFSSSRKNRYSVYHEEDDGLAARILGQNVRLGRPLRVQGLPQAATGAGFSAVVGLACFAARPQDEWWDFEVPQDRLGGRSFKRAIRWFRENW